MDRKKPLSTSCPYCGAGMQTAAMACTLCSVEVRGRFRQNLFQFLTDEEQQLLESFLVADFSIKDLAKESGMGYQAIRSRLDRLIDTYRSLKNADGQKKRILERVAQGELTAPEGAALIRGLNNGRK